MKICIMLNVDRRRSSNAPNAHKAARSPAALSNLGLCCRKFDYSNVVNFFQWQEFYRSCVDAKSMTSVVVRRVQSATMLSSSHCVQSLVYQFYNLQESQVQWRRQDLRTGTACSSWVIHFCQNFKMASVRHLELLCGNAGLYPRSLLVDRKVRKPEV